MIKLCIVDNINKNKVDFVYVLNFFALWYARLGHIGASTMKKMLKCDVISYNTNKIYKCKTCVESMIKRSYQIVNRTSQSLLHIHSNICESNSKLTMGGNMYFITFIDGHSGYTCLFNET